MFELPIKIDPNKAKYFFDYLVVKLESKGTFRSEGSLKDNDQFEEKLYWSILDDEFKDGQIIFIVKWNPDATLEPMIVDKTGNLPEKWEKLARDLIDETLVATINAKREKIFCRYTYAYLGPPLDGEYYISGFRIAPAVFPDDDIMLIDERIIYIDIYEKGIDKVHTQAIGKVHVEQIVSLLSVFLSIGIYSIPTERRWVVKGTEPCKRHQLGYHDIKPIPSEMPKKGQVCSLGHTYTIDRNEFKTPSMTKHLLFPNDIRKLFRSFNNLSPVQNKAYLGAASLFRISLTAGRYYPSVAMWKRT